MDGHNVDKGLHFPGSETGVCEGAEVRKGLVQPSNLNKVRIIKLM